MNVFYPVFFTRLKDKKDTYLIEIPDLNAVSEGFGMEDAYKMARDLIGSTLMEIADELIPAATEVNSIDNSASQFASKGETFVTIIDLDLTMYRRKYDKRCIRRNVSLPVWMNDAANEEGLNVSKILQEALLKRIK